MAQGLLKNYGSPINDSTSEVDTFTRDFAGGFATVFVVINTSVDLLYGYLDPRIRYA